MYKLQKCRSPDHLMAAIPLQWFHARMKKFEKDPFIVFNHEASSLHQYWLQNLDHGAIRTMYYYLQDTDKSVFEFICLRFYFYFYNESDDLWTCRNPSAALVSVLRFTFYQDQEFINEYMIEWGVGVSLAICIILYLGPQNWMEQMLC